MTLPLSHPITAEQDLAAAIALEAALASLAYWSVPSQAEAAPKPVAEAAPVDLSDLEQMYAYY